MSNFLARAQRLSRLRGFIIGYGLLAYHFLPTPAPTDESTANRITLFLLLGMGIQLLWWLSLWLIERRRSGLTPYLRLGLELLADGLSVGLFAYSSFAATHQQLLLI